MKRILLFVLTAILLVTGICAFCSCDSSDEASGDEHEHVAGEWIVETAATCASSGTKKQYCTECNEVVNTETIEKLEHMQGDWQTETEATLKKDGKRTIRCTACSEILKTETICAGSQGLKYKIMSNNTVVITGIGTCTDTEVRIPQTIEGLPVRSINNAAFMANCANIQRIVIPIGVNSIGYRAFDGCTSLEGIYYAGDIDARYDMDVKADNSIFNAKPFYYFSSTKPVYENPSWHYDADGNIAIWD